MPKPAVAGRASRGHRTPWPADLPDVVEGQIAEICRDLAVEAKRIRQLQDQADELRRTVRQWLRRRSSVDRMTSRLLVEDDAEK